MLLDLVDRLGASLHAPEHQQTWLVDHVLGRLIGDASAWAFARALAKRLHPQDVVFCNSEAVGFPLLAVLGIRRNRPRTAVFVHNVDRPRARAALRLLRLRTATDRFVVCSRSQARFLRRSLRLPDEAVVFVYDTTDTDFFTPGAPSPDKTRPVVASLGLEQRDYRNLAAAMEGLHVDVRISAFSTDARTEARALPTTLPANWERRFYPWRELVQLYRDADVVVVSLFENDYAAGVQALMEAQACGRPVVVTATSGLDGYLDRGVVAVPTGDPLALRRAVMRLLDHPQEAAELGREGRRTALERYRGARFTEQLAGALPASDAT